MFPELFTGGVGAVVLNMVYDVGIALYAVVILPLQSLVEAGIHDSVPVALGKFI